MGMQRQEFDARKTGPFVLAVDFDGVIHYQEGGWRKEIDGTPVPNSREVLERLHASGVRIIIHSSRAAAKWVKVGEEQKFENGQVEPMAIWLRKNDIPHDEIWFSPGKPLAHAYLDDRGMHFSTWNQAEVAISSAVQAWKEDK